MNKNIIYEKDNNHNLPTNIDRLIAWLEDYKSKIPKEYRHTSTIEINNSTDHQEPYLCISYFTAESNLEEFRHKIASAIYYKKLIED